MKDNPDSVLSSDWFAKPNMGLGIICDNQELSRGANNQVR